jgi:hypothetical protein
MRILTLPQVQIVRLAEAENMDEGMAVRDIVKEQDVRLALKDIAVEDLVANVVE